MEEALFNLFGGYLGPDVWDPYLGKGVAPGKGMLLPHTGEFLEPMSTVLLHDPQAPTAYKGSSVRVVLMIIV